MNINTITIEEKRNKKRIGKNAYLAIFLSIIACALLMISQVVIALLFVRYIPEEISRTTSILIDMLIYSLSFVIAFGVVYFLFKLFNKNKSPYIAKRYLPRKPVLFIVGTIGVGYASSLITHLLFQNFLENYSIDTSIPFDTPFSIVLYYVYMALLPAIFEEIAFRHIILTNLLSYGKWGAIIFSSLLFGIVHIDPPRVIFATIFGLLLAICREFTGSLIVPMIIHFVNNAISVTLSVAPLESTISVFLSLSIYVFIIVGIVFLIYYPIKGLNNKKISLIKPTRYGYKLSFTKYLFMFVFNIAIVPLALVYYFLFYVHFLA